MTQDVECIPVVVHTNNPTHLYNEKADAWRQPVAEDPMIDTALWVMKPEIGPISLQQPAGHSLHGQS